MIPRPTLIVFDVDGVLVDTRESFQRTTLETVRLFTGKYVTHTELHRWKNRPGFNDDWKLSHAWVHSLGGKFEYEEVKRKFVELYWGKNGGGNVSREKWLLPHVTLQRLAKIAKLAIFTGRIRRELDYTLDRWKVRKYFQQIVSVENVTQPKPHPEGLLQILDRGDRSRAVYVGDNVDDALAARSARMPFLGVLPRQSEERRQRGTRLRKLGAITILGEIRELEKWLDRCRPPA
ncbi:MAG TPA: HAD family hydrolase [Candidatus Angelobacter sp.]|nr:HAD family hydrolase [Candidatus Limnocylindria bacterium]HYL86911.1 HAD family hydrolase [Candidatus Angelobacter sp.]